MTATKSWRPTSTVKVGREDANQVAAPTEREHPPCTERTIAHKECGWKDGNRGGLAAYEQRHGKKKAKCALTSTGLLMEGVDEDIPPAELPLLESSPKVLQGNDITLAAELAFKSDFAMELSEGL